MLRRKWAKCADRRIRSTLRPAAHLAVETLELRLPMTLELVSTADPALLSYDFAFGASSAPSLSGDGRYVAFQSAAANIVAGDANGRTDIFLQDRATGEIQLVSVDAFGVQGKIDSTDPWISANGRYVAFKSTALSFAGGDDSTRAFIYVKDLLTGALIRGSTTEAGADASSNSYDPSLSADGRLLVFESDATNLVADDTNGRRDIFVKDLVSGQVTRASVDAAGIQANDRSMYATISADGTHVAFASLASNLAAGDDNETYDVFVKRLATGEIVAVSTLANGTFDEYGATRPSLSENGRKVAFIGGLRSLVTGQSLYSAAYLRDLDTWAIEQVNVGPLGEPLASGSGVRTLVLSGDASQIALETFSSSSSQTYQPHLVLKDVASGDVVVLNPGQTRYAEPFVEMAISLDGGVAAFATASPELAANDLNAALDVFVYEASSAQLSHLPAGDPALVSVTGHGGSSAASIDQSGRYVVYQAAGDDRLPGDINRFTDIILHDRETGERRLVSTDALGNAANGHSTDAVISRNGRYVVFTSVATNLVAGRGEGIYVKDLETGGIVFASEDVDLDIVYEGRNATISDDGRYVAFEAILPRESYYSTSYYKIYVKDLVTGAVVCASQFGSESKRNEHVLNAVISGNGRYVTMEGKLDEPLYAGNIYRRDLTSGVLVPVATLNYSDDVARSAAMSADGRYIVFELDTDGSYPGIYRKDMQTGEQKWISRQRKTPTGPYPMIYPDPPYPGGRSFQPAISADGRYIAFLSSDRHLLGMQLGGYVEIVVYDESTGAISRPTSRLEPSLRWSDASAPAISGNGEVVVFDSLRQTSAFDRNSARDVFAADVRFAPLDLILSATTVYEGSAAEIGRITVNDLDSTDWTLTLVSGIGDRDNAAFEIVDGNLLRAVGELDYALNYNYPNFRIRATDADGQWLEKAFYVEVLNLPPPTPFDSDATPNAVIEAPSQGDFTGLTVAAPDPGGGAVTYSLVDSAGGRFAIHATTGRVTVQNANGFNYETAASHTIRVRARDAQGLTSEADFAIPVTNLPPAPLQTSDMNTHDEGKGGGIRVANVYTADPRGGAITYSLVDEPIGRFVIDPLTGHISTADAMVLDYESSGGMYVVRARAEDPSGLAVEGDVTIRVRDLAPRPIVDVDPSVVVLPEGAPTGSLVGVTAFAADPGGGNVTYRLGWFTERLQIDSVTGVATVADGSLYSAEWTQRPVLYVIARDDAGNFSTAQFSLQIANLPPAPPIDSDPAANVVPEHPLDGSTVGITAFATDPAGGAIRYALVDSAGGRFAIDPISGLVTVADGSLIDYESSPAGYVIRVRARDPFNEGAEADFTIAISNVPPSTPVDLDASPNLIFDTSTVGARVGVTAAASDTLGGSITYSLADSAGGLFAIDPATGVVTVSNLGARIDDAVHYTIRVRATDSGLAFTESTFLIQAVHNVIAVAAAGGKPKVVIYDAAAHAPIASFYAYAASYRGGVRIAMGDVNGDGILDVAITSGAGPKTRVSVYDGTKLHLLAGGGRVSPAALLMNLAPFGNAYRGGAYVAVAEMNGDRMSEIIVGSGLDKPGEVRVFDGASGQLVRIIKPFGSSYRGGVAVAGGDLNGDGLAEVVAGQATSGSQVRSYDGASGALVAAFKPFGKARSGVDLAIGDVNGDGRRDLITAAGPGGAPRVRVFSGVDYGLVADFMAYGKKFKGGVDIGTLDVDGDGTAEILTGDGDGGGPYVRLFRWTGQLVDQLFANDRSFKDGVAVD